MKLAVVDKSHNKIREKDLPKQFNEVIRADLIHRAVITIQSNKRQKYGAKPDAGKRASAKLSKRRNSYRGSYGHGISRTPRKVLIKRGRRLHWVGAFAPNTVGGRRAHPPKAEKEWGKKINKKERRKALRGAISATVLKEMVENRGHKVPDDYPFIIDTKIESIDKTKEVKDLLIKTGFEGDILRAEKKKIRAGKGKSRGRKYVKKKGPLFVVSGKCKLTEAALNIPGVDIVEANKLNTEILAPGAIPGRATLWTEAAIDILSKEELFL